MSIIMAILVAVLTGSGIYLMMRKQLVEVLFGVLLLSHGINLLLVSMSGWKESALPPILPEGEAANPALFTDPLPQALILTAIVISFGVTSFLVVLMARAYGENRASALGEVVDRSEQE
jgi:multicomponent Na+:H+ antiporter subunit C